MRKRQRLKKRAVSSVVYTPVNRVLGSGLREKDAVWFTGIRKSGVIVDPLLRLIRGIYRCPALPAGWLPELRA